MNNRKINKSLQAIAKKHGIGIEEVRREIELALTLAQNNPDQKVQTFWNCIPSEGNFPTMEEALAHIAIELKKHQNK